MKVSREWLDEFCRVGLVDKEFCEAMTLSGSKVEGVEYPGADIENVVLGRVTELRRHEDSDHLWICSVDIGREKLSIVTGAQNLSVGNIVPVATDGARLPGGTVIQSGELRGVLSQGMLCSLGELGLDTHDFPDADADGIFIVSESAELGADICEVLGLRDSVVEFEITNNRADCLSVRGLARECAVTFDATLNLPEPVIASGSGDISECLSVEVDAPDLCPRYTARVVRDITIEPSPIWMRRRLRRAGVRPINNIVDITNYVMLEYGQPMHAFDLRYVESGKIIVRRANQGESLVTLDGNRRELASDMLMICDEDKPIGIAGVMGGENSEITDSTRDIVFESANFDGTSIRKTAIALGMRTDASGRFEKGLDPTNTVPAIERACELVELLGAGTVARGIIDVCAPLPAREPVKLDPDRINALLGTEIDAGFMVDTLVQLGFEIDDEDMVTAPPWRLDIERLADLAEEVARIYGYDKIVPTEIHGAAAQGRYSEKQLFERELGAVLRSEGFFEILTYSFTERAAWDKIALPEDSPLRHAFIIQNPLGEDSSVMRTTSLPSMLETLGTNYRYRNLSARLYEFATVYMPIDGERLADERQRITLGAYGSGEDFFTMKGALELLLETARIPGLRFEAYCENPTFHPGRCAAAYAAAEGSEELRIGTVGQCHPAVAERFDLDCDVYLAELDLPMLLTLSEPEPLFEPLPRFPAVTRDLALLADDGIPAAVILRTIESAGGEYLESAVLFDVYDGAGIPEGKRSLAYALTLRARDMTLSDTHADEAIDAILTALRDRHGITIRA